MSTPTWEDVLKAAEAVHPFVRHTPVLRAEVDGRPLVLKLEHLQRSGSFKLRGAVNALVNGPLPERVLTASGGNHGLGVATAASLLNVPATVYVPESAPQAKTARIEATGAKLIRHGATYAEAAAKALEAASEPGTRYLPAYDDPAVVAGQGTVAAEVIEDAPDVDAFLVAVGGGGLVAGTSLAGLPTFGVEPERCRALDAALKAGAPVDVDIDSVAASALGASKIGSVPFEVLRTRVTSVLVSDAELLAARDRLWEEFRLAVEPAAAVPFAAWLAGRTGGELPCVILCGANSEWTP
ncbi:serine/threonine dehydratase [Amycolatopsis regifaucium]|uniref:Threonine dehydratase n=1 Tax=Amycolatopsis regifaucium TaxID=546365 RepID=A0A154MLR6_9PSEU|nr:serine/threonine dehydratase [Amycolatopsis regifaucium]KZB85242.1 threonine dehydratase [Amycolatopsis regifaucium]OKA03780.1 threonine dehydratase [Amycolatopsis regifaucium]